MAAIPTLVVYILLQKQFIAGLTLGATKGQRGRCWTGPMSHSLIKQNITAQSQDRYTD